MTLEELDEEWEKDRRKFEDSTLLPQHAIGVPSLHAKYAKFHRDNRIALHGLRMKRAPLFRDLTEYYQGTMNGDPEALQRIGREPLRKKVLDKQMPIFLESDPELMKLDARIALLQEKETWLNGVLTQINKLNYHHNNAITALRFFRGDML
jgi:hypothetical protein